MEEKKRYETTEQIKKRVANLRNRYAEAGLISKTVYILPQDLDAVMKFDKSHLVKGKAGRPSKNK